MYAAVDIGGTKTLVAVFKADGTILEEQKFPTPEKYDSFISELAKVAVNLSTNDFKAVGAAAPGSINRERDIALSFGNLPWKNVPVGADLEKIFHAPVALENDAKLAGLAEAYAVHDKYKRVLYITISTGIGIALIVDGVIDTKIGDGGGRAIILEYRGTMTPWEEFASGKAIVKRFGKKASEIDDPEIWKELARDFAVGFIDLIAVLSPEVIVVGGGVGTHFLKYKDFLMSELKKYEAPLLPIPPVLGAKHAEEAVIYGCYHLVRKKYGKHS
jgi:predicted NBD/HSP70 family sugar kinase